MERRVDLDRIEHLRIERECVRLWHARWVERCQPVGEIRPALGAQAVGANAPEGIASHPRGGLPLCLVAAIVGPRSDGWPSAAPMHAAASNKRIGVRLLL